MTFFESIDKHGKALYAYHYMIGDELRKLLYNKEYSEDLYTMLALINENYLDEEDFKLLLDYKDMAGLSELLAEYESEIVNTEIWDETRKKLFRLCLNTRNYNEIKTISFFEALHMNGKAHIDITDGYLLKCDLKISKYLYDLGIPLYFIKDGVATLCSESDIFMILLVANYTRKTSLKDYDVLWVHNNQNINFFMYRTTKFDDGSNFKKTDDSFMQPLVDLNKLKTILNQNQQYIKTDGNEIEISNEKFTEGLKEAEVYVALNMLRQEFAIQKSIEEKNSQNPNKPTVEDMLKNYHQNEQAENEKKMAESTKNTIKSAKNQAVIAGRPSDDDDDD
ncbi:MAG: hypothetical protein FWG90_01935 [Oscillospiraceae bacterium]|nr:hypothetical protein [Oscillospiraceae bacterium]